jgi:anti-sigma-K factor RskA
MGRRAEYDVTCNERQDQIFLYAADQLEPAEADDLRRHLSTGCPTCAGVLAEAEATLAQVAMSLDPVEPSPETIDKLMSRIAATPKADSSFLRLAAPAQRSAIQEPQTPRTRSSGRRILATSLLSAAAAVAITSGIFFYATRTQREFFRSSNLETVSLTSDTQARGQVLWDRDSGQWRVAVFNLAPPAAGKEYELWFIPPGGKPMRSKTFNVDQNGNASLIVSVPDSIGPIAVAAITDEPIGGVDAPTGQIRLKGAVP